MSEEQKNIHAAELARLHRGVKERFSERKHLTSQANIAKAREARAKKYNERKTQYVPEPKIS